MSAQMTRALFPVTGEVREAFGGMRLRHHKDADTRVTVRAGLVKLFEGLRSGVRGVPFRLERDPYEIPKTGTHPSRRVVSYPGRGER